MGLPGAELNDALRSFIRRIQPGGFIFFKRNLESPSQFFSLVHELHGLCKHRPVMTIDQEGGRVSRLAAIGELPPSGHELRLTGDVHLFQRHGVLTGQLLASLGLNLDLAPVVDFSPDDNADNSLRGRCFGATVDEVIERATAFLEGMQTAGVGGTAKHFPGYTFCGIDPHGKLPMITRTREELEKEELRAFRHFATRAESMMIGHGHFTAWHEKPFPASLSPKIVQKLLREEMGYQGLIMTDDLEMGAIANDFGSVESTRLAMEAGEDMLLICHNPACVEISYDTLANMKPEKTARARKAVDTFLKKLPAPPEKLDLPAFKKINAEIAALREKVQGSLKKA